MYRTRVGGGSGIVLLALSVNSDGGGSVMGRNQAQGWSFLEAAKSSSSIGLFLSQATQEGQGPVPSASTSPGSFLGMWQ